MTNDWYTYWKERGGLLNSAHRPHSVWQNYTARGIYLITIVTYNRARLFGELNNNPSAPSVVLTELGQSVEEQWLQTPAVQSAHGRHICVLGHQVMPDHFHGILQVDDPMDVGIGEIIRGFKISCTQAYRSLYPPCMADSLDRDLLARSSRKQREDYYASNGITPLFEDNYDDTICYHEGQLENIVRYVQDNPRRAIMRALYPDLFQRRQHITIGGMDFAAYGNIFLLRRPWKEQVFCHRWKMNGDQRDYNTPFETTDTFRQQRAQWIQDAKDGAVLVTPGISKGEQQLVKDCIENALPLILLQKEPMPSGWNPELKRHQLCEMGQLLILSPWTLDQMDDVNDVPATTDYSRFHNMNTLAAQICAPASTDTRLTLSFPPSVSAKTCDAPSSVSPKSSGSTPSPSASAMHGGSGKAPAKHDNESITRR